MLEEDLDHPALQGFSPTMEKIKHTVKKTLTGAFKGALLLGSGFGVAAAVGVSPTLLVGWIPGLGSMATAAGGSAIGSALVNGVVLGGFGGAIYNGTMGVLGADEAVEDLAEEKKLHYTRSMQERANNQMLEANMQRYASVAAPQQQVQVQSQTHLPNHGRGAQYGQTV